MDQSVLRVGFMALMSLILLNCSRMAAPSVPTAPVPRPSAAPNQVHEMTDLPPAELSPVYSPITEEVQQIDSSSDSSESSSRELTSQVLELNL
eukprot:4239481-Amphidinium_carterae.1